MEIKDPDKFKEIYEKDPGFAIGLIAENIEQIKENCSCRLEHCKLQIKKSRNRNILIQSVSGFFGGLTAFIATKLGIGG